MEAAIAANPLRLVTFLVLIFAALFVIDYIKRRGKTENCPDCGKPQGEGHSSADCQSTPD